MTFIYFICGLYKSLLVTEEGGKASGQLCSTCSSPTGYAVRKQEVVMRRRRSNSVQTQRGRTEAATHPVCEIRNVLSVLGRTQNEKRHKSRTGRVSGGAGTTQDAFGEPTFRTCIKFLWSDGGKDDSSQTPEPLLIILIPDHFTFQELKLQLNMLELSRGVLIGKRYFLLQNVASAWTDTLNKYWRAPRRRRISPDVLTFNKRRNVFCRTDGREKRTVLRRRSREQTRSVPLWNRLNHQFQTLKVLQRKTWAALETWRQKGHWKILFMTLKGRVRIFWSGVH